jgi:hypothetical protein
MIEIKFENYLDRLRGNSSKPISLELSDTITRILLNDNSETYNLKTKERTLLPPEEIEPLP